MFLKSPKKWNKQNYIGDRRQSAVVCLFFFLNEKNNLNYKLQYFVFVFSFEKNGGIETNIYVKMR